MVELVNNDDVEVIRRKVLAGFVALRLWMDANTWSKSFGPRAADPFLAKGSAAQCISECGEALVEYLVTMSNEKQPGSRQLVAEAGIVDGSHHGLAGASGGDEQVFVVTANA